MFAAVGPDDFRSLAFGLKRNVAHGLRTADAVARSARVRKEVIDSDDRYPHGTHLRWRRILPHPPPQDAILIRATVRRLVTNSPSFP